MKHFPIFQAQDRSPTKQDKKVTVYDYNVDTDAWEKTEHSDETPGDIHSAPQKRERHWVLSAIPIWLIIIAIFLFLALERHLTVYVDDTKILEVNYTLLGNRLNSIILYDSHGEKAARLSHVNRFGAEGLILTYSGDQEDTYMTTIYRNGILYSRIEHYGQNHTKTIHYSTDGLIESFEETTDGITKVYKFREELCEDTGYMQKQLAD